MWLDHRLLVMSKPPSKDEPQARAEASFKRKEMQARDGAKAMAEYEAQQLATQKKTARLRALREEKEAKEAEAAEAAASAKAAGVKDKGAKPATPKTAGTKAAGPKPRMAKKR